MTLETSNLGPGVRCSLVLYFIMLWLSLQCVRTTSNHRLKRLTEEDVCKETNKTIERLENFPVSYTIFQERMQQKKCDNLPKCNGEVLVYHCVRYKDDLVEVCAPRRLITGSYCAVFDIGIGRVIEDFSRPCSECPFKYPSADAMNYSSCMKKEKMQISSPTSNRTPSTRIKKIIGTTGSPCCDGSRCKRTAKGCAKNKSTSFVVITNENHPTSGVKRNTFPWNIIILIAAILGTSLVFTFSFVLYLNRKKRSNRRREEEKGQIGYTLSADKKITNDTIKPLILIAETEFLNSV